jgi:O-phosphoseryl-tRNA(Cys) synthetase
MIEREKKEIARSGYLRIGFRILVNKTILDEISTSTKFGSVPW